MTAPRDAPRDAPALLRFDDITVTPMQRHFQRVLTGGPIWPAFETQTAARQCRRGVPVDVCPAAMTPGERVTRPAVWGGMLDRNFGHLVAEHLPRLPFALRDRPDDLYLFAVERGQRAATLPDWIWQLLAWFDLPRAQVQVVKRPVQVATLRVAPQAEALPDVPPSPGYLDLLDAIAARNRLVPEPAPLVYVSRAGMAQAGKGGHLGEGYLVDCLRRLGVAVIDPAALPLRRQMAVYAGARVLVFAEGSALHGRQILGRVDQEIHVLRRRPGRNPAQAMLEPRVRRLTYHETVAAQVMEHSQRGRPRPALAAAVYALPALFQTFAALGVDLGRCWNPRDYAECLRTDAAAWLTGRGLAGAALADARATLAAAGVDLAAEGPARRA